MTSSDSEIIQRMVETTEIARTNKSKTENEPSNNTAQATPQSNIENIDLDTFDPIAEAAELSDEELNPPMAE